MTILIAEDDPVSRRILEKRLGQWGHQVTVCADGKEAIEHLQADSAPRLLILDWMMPGLDGLAVIREVQSWDLPNPLYIILLTARENTDDLVEGLDAGADDYVTKPFNPQELRARIRAGERILNLQAELAGRVKELESSLEQVKRLQGLLPICSYCKKVRNDQNYWQEVDYYMAENSEAQFSHSICPNCYETVVRKELDELRAEKRQG